MKYFFKDSSHEIAKPRIKLRELFNHHVVNYFAGFVIHDLMDMVIDGIGWVLQLF